jgi:putative methylase
MKKRDLEIILQKLPPHPAPMVKLEQYSTPAIIAADIVFNAYLEENINDKVMLDLGCGTGIFAIGAKLLGAREAMGIDVDGTALTIAKGYANTLSLDITFHELDISEVTRSILPKAGIDTIIQNPPFGAQKTAKGADRIFLEKALEFAKIVYSLHLTKTDEFITLLVNKLGGEITWKKKYVFPINHIFHFHTQEKVDYDVTLFKIKSKLAEEV